MPLLGAGAQLSPQTKNEELDLSSEGNLVRSKSCFALPCCYSPEETIHVKSERHFGSWRCYVNTAHFNISESPVNRSCTWLRTSPLVRKYKSPDFNSSQYSLNSGDVTLLSMKQEVEVISESSSIRIPQSLLSSVAGGSSAVLNATSSANQMFDKSSPTSLIIGQHVTPKNKVKVEEQVSLGPQVLEGENVFGVAHIFASFNDTFVHITDLSGK